MLEIIILAPLSFSSRAKIRITSLLKIYLIFLFFFFYKLSFRETRYFFSPKEIVFSYLDHFWILPAGDEVSVQIDDHQRTIPQPARFQAKLRALHRVHSNRAERLDRIHDQVAQLADLSPLRGWLLLLLFGPPPPPKEDDHGSGPDNGRRHVREPSSVCFTKRSPINYPRSSDHAKRSVVKLLLWLTIQRSDNNVDKALSSNLNLKLDIFCLF